MELCQLLHRSYSEWGQTFIFIPWSGLAIDPFLYGGVVKEFQWLNEQQFLDAVAVAMITPGAVPAILLTFKRLQEPLIIANAALI